MELQLRGGKEKMAPAYLRVGSSDPRDPCGVRPSFSRLTRTMEIYETVPLQPQVPSSKEGSVSLITSITTRAS